MLKQPSTMKMRRWLAARTNARQPQGLAECGSQRLAMGLLAQLCVVGNLEQLCEVLQARHLHLHQHLSRVLDDFVRRLELVSHLLEVDPIAF